MNILPIALLNLLHQARELAVGREISDNVVIVALDAYLVDEQ